VVRFALTFYCNHVCHHLHEVDFIKFFRGDSKLVGLINIQRQPRAIIQSLALALLLVFLSSPSGKATTLPAGFAETQIATGITDPTAMAFAPDGRLFVCQQTGQLRIIKNGTLLSTPFLTVTTDTADERGLLGVAFDPNFTTNQFIYVYYTVTSTPRHNRVSRFTANGDTVVPGSESIIFELDNLSAAFHNGGAIHFGSDGKLYIAVGDNGNSGNSQSLATVHGKMLRINSNGTIPTDNPFYNSTTGNNRAIWAWGLRNPFTFAFQNGTGRMFINDVGQSTWEEINDGIAASNYGWPTTEGVTGNPNFRSPLFAYDHNVGPTGGCAITGGAFYNPPVNQFPAAYIGKYFFADFCSGWIRRFDPSNSTVSSFATGLIFPVDLQVSSDGSLYYLARDNSGGGVYRISYTANQAPSIGTHPVSQTIAQGQPVTFSVGASGTAPLSYQWQRNGVDIPNANSQSYTIASVALSDNGAGFRVIVTNSFGGATSNEATLTVTANQPPTGNITSPVAGTLYSAGQTINYSGTATDPETGSLPASAFTWQVDFHHDTHAHPFILATSGATSGSFTIPTTGETSPNVWYRIYLTVRDSAGLTHTSFRDILPRTSTITLQTNSAGLQLTLDGQPVTTPVQVVSVVGLTRTLGVVSPQVIGGVSYYFSAWSDAGAATHSISTPTSNTTYTATFTAQPQTLSFSAASYSAGEGSGSLAITVIRAQGTSGEVSVDYAVNGGTASERTDYTTFVGTLRFLNGETSKTLTLLLTEDGFVDGNKTVNLVLSNPKVAILGGQSVATVTITDNDTAPSSNNPINQTPVFVQQHYHDFLNRAPEPAGYQGWQNILNNCPPSGKDANGNFCDRIEVSSAFFRSLEFQQRGFFVYRFYSSSYGRIPRYTEFMPDMARVSGFQTAGEEEASKVAFVNDFMARQEFKNRYDAVTDPRAYVGALETAAGVILASREALIADLAAGRKTRAEVLRAVAESQEVYQKYFNQAFVVMQYFGYLRRDPDALYLNWIDTLNQTGDYRVMVNGFINSAEYRSRFGQ
jgi:glucose/arabinose dehydrogenase